MRQKKLLLPIMASLFLTAFGYQGFKALSQEEEQRTQLFMQNVEALSEDEITKPWVYPDGLETGGFECGSKLSNGKKCTFRVITCGGGGKGCNPRPCNLHG